MYIFVHFGKRLKKTATSALLSSLSSIRNDRSETEDFPIRSLTMSDEIRQLSVCEIRTNYKWLDASER